MGTLVIVLIVVEFVAISLLIWSVMQLRNDLDMIEGMMSSANARENETIIDLLDDVEA